MNLEIIIFGSLIIIIILLRANQMRELGAKTKIEIDVKE